MVIDPRRSVSGAVLAWLRWPWLFWRVWRMPQLTAYYARGYATSRCYRDWWAAWRGPPWLTWQEVDQARQSRDAALMSEVLEDRRDGS